MPREVFFDTPMFAERMFGERESKARIEALTKTRRAYSSNYVREQFKGTFLRAAILAHNRLMDRRNVPQVLRDLDKFAFVKKGDGVKARAVLIALLEIGDLTIDDMLDTLSRWIEWQMLDQFEYRITIVDGTCCCLCSSQVARDESAGTYHLQKACNLTDPKPCKIEEFWDVHAGELRSIADMDVSKAPKGVRDIRLAAQEVVDEKAPPRGKRCFVPLSDAVIACESPVGSDIATTNIRDFEFVVRAIAGDRDVINPIADNDKLIKT